MTPLLSALDLLIQTKLDQRNKHHSSLIIHLVHLLPLHIKQYIKNNVFIKLYHHY